MWYVYFIENAEKGFMYTGYTSDLRSRLQQHNAGESQSTKHYAPLKLVSYVAVRSEKNAQSLEKYFKTGSGKAILKKRILQLKS